ncbi:hemagglutinin repeat-containing protein, partial [Paraburkholderia caballeronis]|uniref:hemagglutinin repeat-containing protein n=1 Tax=Paraburkholderia caballeronis TaxID=416943 RepID=UPI001065FD25
MNKNTYRLVWSAARGMPVAVEETATGNGKASQGKAAGSRATSRIALFAMRHVAFAALALFGLAPWLADAQIVPSGAHAPNVIGTANGLPQVNVQKPSGAGVSVNTYSQFDVQRQGAILNNSPVITNTQLAGQINGNPNFGANDAAKIIINQVNSSNPSQLRGYVEVAGKRAEVVVANGSGIVVDGGGFINTTRGILTTGNPVLDASGNLSGFNVNGGSIAVQGAGLNATNVDQVDLIARAVQANAAIYANTLNVVTGANAVNHDTLAAQAIQGGGAAPGVSIDVSQLGGMYANRITLVGTENGVGVANAGTLAAQAGDLMLTTQGQLVQSGKLTASGNVAINAASIANSGTIYAQQNASVGTSGTLANSGTLAAQQDTTINAGSVASTGLLGAGINGDGTPGNSGNLAVSALGLLSATGRNIAPGSVTLNGVSVDLTNAQTWAGTALNLTATGGNLSLVNATTGAGSSIAANVAATLDNSGGTLNAPQLAIRAGNLANRGGTITQTGTGATGMAVSGTLDNTGGLLRTNSADLTLAPATLVNDGGTIANSGAGTLSVSTGSLSNNGGTLATNGALDVQAGAVSNRGGMLAAQTSATIHTGSLDNSAGGQIGAQDVSIANSGTLNNAGGSVQANGTLGVAAQSIANDGGVMANGGTGATTVTVAGALTNTSGGQIGGNGAASVSAGTFDNSNGRLAAAQLALQAGTLANRGGTITQTGTGTTRVAVTGALDNTGGLLQTNGTDLRLDAGTLVNDSGAIADSGTGTLSVSTGSLSNNGGTLATNGALDVQAAAVSNQGGTLAAQSSATIHASSLDNRAGGQITAQAVSISDTGAFNNAGGTVQADGTLGVAAQTIVNEGGTIANAGTGVTTVAASGALTNTGNGLIGGNGDASISGGGIDNSGGSLVAGGALSTQSGSTLDNTAGLIQASGDASVSAQGAIANAGGQIGANGTLQVSGASLDNASGRVANTGTGATAVNAGTVTNSNTAGTAGAGVIGGNGDVTVSGQSLSNIHGGQIVAGHDLTLDESSFVDNSGGTLSAANSLTLDGTGAAVSNTNGSIRGNGAVTLAAASLDNTSGRIGNDAGSGGSVAITTGALANQGGAIGSDQNLTLTTGQLAGDGTIIAGQDGAVTVNGDYAHGAANQIQANHDLTLTVAGNLTSQGALTAVNALTVNAANVDNQAGADLNSASTTVNAEGAITNEGRIEGDAVTTNSATLTNTATIIGNTLTLNGSQSIANDGAAAIIAGASRVNLYSPGDISNTGGANVFSLGDVNIAADATRDASGYLANRASSVTNDQSTLQAQGNIEIAAQTLTNTRPAPTVETATTDVETLHQTKRAKYIGCTTVGTHDPGDDACRGTETSGKYQLYANPTSATYAASQVVSQTSGPNAIDRALTVNVDGIQQTIWYNTVTTHADGSVTVVYWDGYDPNINYDPATEYRTRSDAHNGYQRVEIARDTTTTTQQDQVSGTQAQQARLLAGGNLTLANVGTLNNEYSAIAAGGSIQIGSSTQDGALDPSGSGSYGGTLVNNVGQTLYQYQQQGIVSTYAWNEDIGRDVGRVVQPSVVLAPVAIGGTGGTIIANNAVSISGTDINNTNVAAANSATGATGGTLGANGAAAAIDGGRGQTVNLATGQPTTVNAPQTVADSSGSLHITLPTSGLYSLHTAPNASYLVETDPRFTSYTKFISSDYMLGQLGLNPQTVEKRLGDGLYEQQLVQNQITQLTGRVYLQGYSSALDEYTALMTSGVNFAQQFGLEVGMALTAAQMDALTSDIVWLVNQPVTLPDGSTQNVLVPQVYLAQTHANDLQPTGALIAADDVQLHATGSVTSSGTIQGGTQTVVTGTNIVNRGGTIASSGANGTTVVSATGDVVNASGLIAGNRVAVLAGNNITNTTLVDGTGVSSAVGGSKVSQTLLGAKGTIASTGDMLVSAGNDLTVHGANITAGGSASVSAGNDLTVDAVQSATSQSLTQNANRHWEENSVTNGTSTITAGGNLAVQSGHDMTLKGAQVTAGGDLAAVAGGNLTATTVTNTAKYDNVAADSKTRQEVDHTYNEQAVGTEFTAGGNATLGAVSADASKGNVTLTGSSLTAGVVNGVDTGAGAANIAATGSVTLNEAREEHDSYQSVQSRRGSFVSSTTTDTMQNTQANVGVGSLVSGDTVNVQAGKDLTVQGSSVVGTNDVNLAAKGNVNITTSQDAVRQDSAYQQTHSGLMTSGLSLTIGSQSMSDQQQASQVTNNGSVVGSVNGNLNVSAGNDLHVTGSVLHAGQDVSMAGKTVTIDSAYDTASQADQQKSHSAGLTVGITNPVVSAVQTATQVTKAAQHVDGDPRLLALTAATTGLAAKNAYDAVGGDPVKAATTVGINISLGASSSHSSGEAQSSTAVGSTVAAGRNVTIAAAGAGADSNINVTGSTISAGNDALLAAQGNVNLQAAQNTSSQNSSSSGASAGVGVSISVGSTTGISFTANAAGSRGNADGDSTTWTNTHAVAGNTLTVRSGGDTNLVGAVASGNQVVADVGGNLNIQSLQETDHYNSKDQSAGIGVSVCVPPLCAGKSSVSGSFSQTKMNSDYTSVTEQSGIRAGDGGFQVNVAGNTDLKGSVIASSDEAVKAGVNSLTTSTLTSSDITNHASYDASQVALSGGYAFGGSSAPAGKDGAGQGSGMGKDQQGKADNVNPVPGTSLPSYHGIMAAPPVVLGASGDADSTTRSAVSGGALNITNSAAQQQLTGQTAEEAAASISRDTSNTAGALAPIFDKDKIEAGFEITGQFMNQVGQFVQNRAAEADAAQKAANDPTLTPEQRAAAQQQADQLNAAWGPNGTYRQALTALTVAAGGNVTGGMGELAQNAAVAYFQGLGANQVKQLVSLIGDGTAEGETARAALQAIVGCAGAAASSQACGAGAMGAASSSLIGWALGPADGLSAADKQARENLVNSLVGAVAAATNGGSGAATVAGAGQIEVENNQLGILAKKN